MKYLFVLLSIIGLSIQTDIDEEDIFATTGNSLAIIYFLC
jgi:hypothetical protein